MNALSLSSARPSSLRRALSALRDLRRDPNRLDRVFVLGEAVNKRAFRRIYRRFERDADGRLVLADRPAINSRSVDLDALAALPDGTLGREYVRFLRDHGITPDVFKAPEGINPRAAYLAQRIRQTHDLWHVLTGYETDVPGEVLLQAFTFAQLGAPSALLISLFGALRVGLRRPGFLSQVLSAYEHGRRARFLAPIYWERHWADPVESLRVALSCPTIAA